MGIIGPSGSGKSTLLRALNRLWEPPSGTVFLDGKDITGVDVLELRRKVGMLFQLPVLFEGNNELDSFFSYPKQVWVGQRSQKRFKVQTGSGFVVLLSGYEQFLPFY